ncbi:MAG: DUF4129 domain-containing protein [Anaerolineae bacterium]
MAGDFVNRDKPVRVARNPWVDHLLRPALLTVMIACLSVAAANLVKTINPAWRGGYFLPGMVLAAIEAMYSFVVLTRYRPFEVSRLRFRLVEWGVLILLLKGLTYWGQPWAVIAADVKAVARTPHLFVPAEFAVFLLLAALAWGAATATMKDFDALYDPFTYRAATIEPFNNLTLRFFWGGGALVLVSGITQWAARAGLKSLVDLTRPSLGGILLNVLLYFTLGLALLSHARLTMLLTRWEIQQVTVSGRLVRRWVRYGLVLLAMVSTVVFVLPTGYSVGFLASLRLVIAFALNALLVLMLLISLPFALLASLFGGEQPAPRPPPVAPPVMPPAAAATAPPNLAWLDVARSFIFWMVVAAITVYLARTYLKDHPGLWRGLWPFRRFRLATGWLWRVWVWLAGLARAGADLLPKRVALRRRAGSGPPPAQHRRLWLGAMPARERILYYYLSTLKQAGPAGAVRQKHHTPAEFAPRLSRVIPGMEAEVDLLTGAFVRARYSRHSFDHEQAAVVKVVWRQIRAALKRAALQRG